MLTNTHEPLLEDLTATQRQAVCHEEGPLLIIAGAGTGKTTVITRRIAWLLMTERARAEEILALTFTDKAAAEMEERLDVLLPYGYVNVRLSTFHAFGDELLRAHALALGRSPNVKVLSQAEQLVFLRQHVFALGLAQFRPLGDPTKFLKPLATMWMRAKDEAVGSEEFLAYAEELSRQAQETPADSALQVQALRVRELASSYAQYEALLRAADLVDFGDQVLLAVRLLEQHPDVRAEWQRRFRYILVDEFQDTNYTQFRLLQLLTEARSHVTVVGDDDQSIYKWRGAALSNVLKFLEHYTDVKTVVLTENFRSSQAILDCAYRLIRFNDPDRLEVRRGIDKRLVAKAPRAPQDVHFHVFDTASSEADWVARTIRQDVEAGRRRPSEFAILVRSNREADLFLRALNVAGLPWRFSGASGLFTRQDSKLLSSCLKTLADPDDSMSWYHVASSSLYGCAMHDLAAVLARATRTNQSVRTILEQMERDPSLQAAVSAESAQRLQQLLTDVRLALEWSRTRSAGQVLYQWLSARGWLAALGRTERVEETLRLNTVARFFDQLHRLEELVGGRLPELMSHWELFQAMGDDAGEPDDAWADCVQVLTLHKAKGLEFPVVFLVGLVQGRFPTPERKDLLELPEPLIKDILPSGDYHLQEERRLFYVGMTRAQEVLHLVCAYDYGGKTVRKVSQFILEALNLASPSPPARTASARALIERAAVLEPLPVEPKASTGGLLRLDPHGVDDYLTCPLKYRYSHVLRVPVLRHHLVVYGAALHKAVEAFFARRLQGGTMGQAECLDVFERHWHAEGFLTKEHEQLRLAQGRETLQRFCAAQQAAPESPTLIEQKFAFPLDDILVVGRWDRVDCQDAGAIIIDYKSSDVKEPSEANRRARESLQMLLYALAWRTLHGVLPLRVELRFLETGLTGQASFTEADLKRAKTFLHQAATGIRAGKYPAKPQEHACRWCAFQSICPCAFQTHPSSYP